MIDRTMAVSENDTRGNWIDYHREVGISELDCCVGGKNSFVYLDIRICDEADCNRGICRRKSGWGATGADIDSIGELCRLCLLHMTGSSSSCIGAIHDCP